MYSLTFAVGNTHKLPHHNGAELLGIYFVSKSDMKKPTHSVPAYSVTSFTRSELSWPEHNKALKVRGAPIRPSCSVGSIYTMGSVQQFSLPASYKGYNL